MGLLLQDYPAKGKPEPVIDDTSNESCYVHTLLLAAIHTVLWPPYNHSSNKMEAVLALTLQPSQSSPGSQGSASPLQPALLGCPPPAVTPLLVTTWCCRPPSAEPPQLHVKSWAIRMPSGPRQQRNTGIALDARLRMSLPSLVVRHGALHVLCCAVPCGKGHARTGTQLIKQT